MQGNCRAQLRKQAANYLYLSKWVYNSYYNEFKICLLSVFLLKTKHRTYKSKRLPCWDISMFWDSLEKEYYWILLLAGDLFHFELKNIISLKSSNSCLLQALCSSLVLCSVKSACMSIRAESWRVLKNFPIIRVSLRKPSLLDKYRAHYLIIL